MFGTLIESRAVTPRRTGGSVASILIHSLIITGGVVATARDVIGTRAEPPIAVVVPYVRRVDPRPVDPRRPASVSNASAVPAPFIQRLAVPTIIPVGIPPIDMTGSVTPIDFGHGRIGTPGIFCERDCAATPATDSAGRQLWNTRDLMMRMLEEPVPPRYPESLRRAGVEGDVVVRFVVDTTGRVDMRTVEVLQSTHDAFTIAVRETLPKLRFAPATGGERTMRALAVMPFRFTLR
jgi:periplasmic protein TonB